MSLGQPVSQGRLPLVLSERTRLVCMYTARAVLGIDTDSVIAKVDNGELRWVWDVGVHGVKNAVVEYRFLAAELSKEQSFHTIEDVIAHCVPAGRDRLRRGELVQMMMVSRVHVHNLVKEGELRGDAAEPLNFVTMRSVTNFLRLRWMNRF